MDDNIFVADYGSPDCIGDAAFEQVSVLPNGLPGPWVRTTCRKCTLDWYAKMT